MYGKGGKQSKKEKILSENGSREKYLDGIKLLKLNEFIFHLSIYLSVFHTGYSLLSRCATLNEFST